MTPRVVVDTSVFIAALINPKGTNREMIRRCLLSRYKPLLGNAMIAEYEDVVSRATILEHCPVSQSDVRDLLEAFCAVSQWVSVYYLWRPNLADEADNHVVELAAAGNAQWIVTNNVRDFSNAELNFPKIRVLTPQQILKGA